MFIEKVFYIPASDIELSTQEEEVEITLYIEYEGIQAQPATLTQEYLPEVAKINSVELVASSVVMTQAEEDLAIELLFNQIETACFEDMEDSYDY